jgi:hypothetical protein
MPLGLSETEAWLPSDGLKFYIDWLIVRGQGGFWILYFSSSWKDSQTVLVASLILWRSLFRQQYLVIRETLLGRLMRYLVVSNFGCLPKFGFIYSV